MKHILIIILLAAILSLYSLCASSQEFRVGSTYLPIDCTIEQFNEIWKKEYPQKPVDIYEHEDYAVMRAFMSKHLSFIFLFRGKSSKRYIHQAIIDKIVPTKKAAKQEIKFAMKELSSSRSYVFIRKLKNSIGLYDYKYSTNFMVANVYFLLYSFKDDYGLIHCCSANEYPMLYQ